MRLSNVFAAVVIVETIHRGNPLKNKTAMGWGCEGTREEGDTHRSPATKSYLHITPDCSVLPKALSISSMEMKGWEREKKGQKKGKQADWAVDF